MYEPPFSSILSFRFISKEPLIRNFSPVSYPYAVTFCGFFESPDGTSTHYDGLQ